MTLTKPQEHWLDVIADLPDDDWQPHDWDTFQTVQEAIRADRARRQRAATRRTQARATRRERQKVRDEDRGWWTLEDGYAAVDARSGGRCEAGVFGRAYGRCPHAAFEHHHIAGRKIDDPHNPDNLWHLCQSCHDWAGRNPIEAKRVGLSADRLGV